MSATVAKIFAEATPVAMAMEVITVANGSGDADTEITPASIKQIIAVVVQPTSASAAAYLKTFTPGAGSFIATAAGSATYTCLVFGRIA